MGHSGEARTPYLQAFAGWTLAQGAERYASIDPVFSKRLETAAESCLRPIAGWVASYGQMQEIHGEREPAWLHSQPEAASEAILAWTTLDKLHPNPTRRDLVQKFAAGLVLLHHIEPQKYPFRAHTSFAPGRPDFPAYAPLQEVGKAPGAMWIPERSRQVEALVTASEYLVDKSLLEEAQQEGLGMWTHLVVSGKLPVYFAPSPEGKASLRSASVVIDQFRALQRSNPNAVYATLLSLAANWEHSLTPQCEADKDALRWIRSSTARLPDGPKLRQASDLYPPVSYQIMQAEEGKAVQKAFDLVNVVYPGGNAGKMARVGRENMFWMRFDVDREEDYFFHMVFLKSKLEGGLISVMMRIDGDKIFKVPLGGATDAFVDMDFVDGPRTLRQGPHSFGIRFSGLLMTQPALLDCVVAWPVVERRFLKLDAHRRMLILHNNSPMAAKATCKEVAGIVPVVTAVDGSGAPASLGREVDKRRRKEYIVVPAAGTAVLEWNEGNSSSNP
ncbi:unnamed protein product [Phaeothamnion confervicola]